jgi:hypothetical protein
MPHSEQASELRLITFLAFGGMMSGFEGVLSWLPITCGERMSKQYGSIQAAKGHCRVYTWLITRSFFNVAKLAATHLSM